MMEEDARNLAKTLKNTETIEINKLVQIYFNKIISNNQLN
jgi:hypothetical protein